MINEFQYIDSYEKALSFFTLKLEKTNNEYLKSINTNNFTKNDFIYYLEHYCNVGIIVNDFNYSIGYSIPFDQNYYLNENGAFYDSIITKNESSKLLDLPLPLFQSIYTYIPLHHPPNYVDTTEKYIVWLAYQMKNGGSDIDIIHETNIPNKLNKFLINSRNLKLFQNKSGFPENTTYPQYDIDIEKGYINITHIFNLNKNYLFRYGNFTNSILPEITKNPQIKNKNNQKIYILSGIKPNHKKYRIIKPLNIVRKNRTHFSQLKNKYIPVIRTFADIANITDFSSSGGKFNVRWNNESNYNSSFSFAKYQFTGLFYVKKYATEGGKLDARLKLDLNYNVVRRIHQKSDVKNNVEIRPIKNYIYKNWIKEHR